MTPLSREQLMSTVRDLPALPAVVMDLIELLGTEDVATDQLAQRISHDQALTAKTLRLANSSFYGIPRQVKSVTDAIAVLGLRTLRTVVTAAGLTGSFKPQAGNDFDFNAFWRHSIGTAVCARLLAEATRLDTEAAFTVGLLHDIGRLVLVSCFAQAHARTQSHRREHDAGVLESEHAILGLDHAEVGALMAEHWRFSPDLVAAIRHHHMPNPSARPDLAGLVHVADNIAHALDLSRLEDDGVPALCGAVWLGIGLDTEQCLGLFQQTESQTQAVCDALLS